MRAIVLPKYGGPEVLRVETRDPPPCGPAEVRVRIHAAGLNFAEVMARKGLYPDAPKPPCVLGYEGAGVVEAVGNAVGSVRAGQRVLVMTRFGGHAEVVTAPESQVLPMPEAMSFEEGAALPVNYLTAYHMLYRVACVRPGERVLVHGAAGGVGVAVLQLCKAIGGVEVFGTASPAKHAFLRELGCAHPIDYRSADYAEEVRRITGGAGVDVVLDPLGGDDWRKGYALLRPAGRLVAYGFSNMASGERRNVLRVAWQATRVPIFTPLGLMDANRSVAGVNVGHLWNETELLRGKLTAPPELYTQGAIKPHVGETFAFDRAADAHRALESRRTVGKVLLVP